MQKKEFINRIHELISLDLGIDGVEILYRSKEYFCAEYVSAHFNPLSYRIYINEDWLKRADVIEIIRVVAHELRHAYQKASIEFSHLMEKKHSKKEFDIWKMEFNNYSNPIRSLEVYNAQHIELDAENYALKLLKKFLPPKYYINDELIEN